MPTSELNAHTMPPRYSVIICTHNPRSDYLNRTLKALQAQTLPCQQWELLLIDNASTEQVADAWDLSWHSGARHIREDELGLTHARIRGIREARGQMLILVDDDNVLAPDFLDRVAVIAAAHPHLGVIGSGSVEPEFEVQPPRPLLRLAANHGGLLPLLALKRVSSPLWSNNPLDRSSMPWGAGLCVTRETAASYVDFIHRLNITGVLDRRGKELFSAGDDLFSWTTALSGKGFGVFPSLHVVHLISAGRLETGYFLQLIRGWWVSESILNYLLAGVQPRRIGLEQIARILLAGARNGLFSLRYKLAGARGEDQGRRWIARNQLQPLPRVLAES